MYRVTESTLIQQLHSDNGLCRSLRATIEIQEDDRHPRAGAFLRKLTEFHDPSHLLIHRLYDYQIQTACNIAYRPRLLTVSRPQTLHELPATLESSYEYETAGEDEDIGSVSLNDLFTGSGKTLVSMLAAIEVATERRSEIFEKGHQLMREQSTSMSWLTGVQSRAPPAYSHAIIVFSPKHLTGQWQRAALHALHILKVRATTLINPLKERLVREEATGTLVIAIYDNVKKVKGNLLFVPCIVTDEFVMQGEHNYAARSFDELKTKPILFGRLILVSADAGNVKRILSSLRNASLIKRWASVNGNSWSYSTSIVHMAGASSLTSAGRENISFSMGLETPVFIHSMRYVPTVAGVIFGSAFEVSQQSGVDKFRHLGVFVSECTTTQDIIKAVQHRLAAPVMNMLDGADDHGRPRAQQALLMAQDRRVRETLIDCLHRMSRFTSSAENSQCPICYDEMEESCMIQPCWHVICKTCMRIYLQRTNVPCPMCRTPINGHVTSLREATAEEDEGAEHEGAEGDGMRFSSTLSESLRLQSGPAPGLFKSVISILLCLEHHNRVDSQESICFRALVAVPQGIEFHALCAEFHSSVPPERAWLAHFTTIGTVQHHITASVIEEQLAHFGSERGERFKVLFTSEGSKDSMIGLDLQSVDALISVGAGNVAQRIGRLTRLGRTFKRGRVHHFDLQPQ